MLRSAPCAAALFTPLASLAPLTSLAPLASLTPLVFAAACGGPSTTSPPPTSPPAPTTPRALELTSAARLIGKGTVSTEHAEIRMTIDPSGTLALWGSPNRPGGAGGWDLWMSRRARPEAPWGEAQPAPFNSPANDFDPAFSPDGRELYFFSNRPGGQGGDDLYRVAFDGAAFGPARALGPEINSPGNEWAPAISPDNSTLLFATDGRGGAGRHDLFFAERQGEGFAAARAVPGTINTADDELDATFLSDGRSLVFSRSTNVDEAPIALVFASPRDGAYPEGAPLSTAVNVDGGYTLGPAISWAARDVLIFSGKRSEDSAGSLDLYEIHYRLNDAGR